MRWVEKRIIMLVVAGALALCLAGSAQAVPNMINYQGKLLKNGDPLTTAAPISMTFKIFIEETDTGGSPIWTEYQNVDVVDGIYAVKLGAVTPLDSSLFEDPGRDYWLEVTVGTETLSPRQRLTSVAFALQAENAATLDGYTASELDQSAHVTRTDNPHNVTAAQIGATTLADLTWGNLSGIPTDIADGDNDSGGDITAVIAGTGLAGGGYDGDVTLGLNVPLNLHGTTAVGNTAIISGENTGAGYGIKALSTSNYGLYAQSSSVAGILGYSNSRAGVEGINGDHANVGKLGTEKYGVYGKSYNDYSGYFDGNVKATGELYVDGNAKFSGNLGIGTDNPTLPLYIQKTKSGLTYPMKIENKAAGDAPGESDVGILFSTGGSGSEDRGKGALVYETTGTWNRGSFHFLQNSSANANNPGTANSVMTITNFGRVGIGTTTPAVSLDIAGAVHAISYGPIFSNSLNAVYGKATTNGGNGVYGEATATSGIGIHGKAMASNARAGYFEGNVETTGDLDVGGMLDIGSTLKLAAGGDRYILLPDNTHTLFIGGRSTDNTVPWGIRSESAGYIGFATNGQDRLRIDANGNVGIGTTAPAYKLQVMGQIAVQSIYLSSDVRLKKNIVPIENALEKVAKLRGVEFQWNDALYEEEDSKVEMGLIAQEVETVVPEVVSDNEQGYKSVEYANLVSLLIEAVKDLKAQNEELRSRVMRLEDKAE